MRVLSGTVSRVSSTIYPQPIIDQGSWNGVFGLPRILVVDDEPDISKSVKIGLQRRGFEVEAFEDPTEAVQHYQAGRYDMLLIDVRMPKMSGFDFVRQIKKTDPDVPFAFLTAFDIHPDDFKRAFPGLEASVILKKPMLSEDLAKAVKVEIGRHRGMQP